MLGEKLRAGLRRIDLSRQAKELGAEFEERPSDMVAVTGFAQVGPYGNTYNTALAELVGKSGIRRFEEGSNAITVAAQAIFNPKDYFSERELKRLPMVTAMDIVVAREAAKMAGILDDEGNLQQHLASRKRRIAANMPSGTGPVLGVIDTYLQIERGERTPAYEGLQIFPEQPTASVSRIIQAQGWGGNSSEACATSLSSIADSWLRIRSGINDIEIAGGSEDALSTHPEILSRVFGAMRAISQEADPQKASLPFNVNRSGFVPASGAGAVVLERLDSALEREANIYAVIISARKGMDAGHPTNMDPDRIAVLILDTLKDRDSAGFFGVDAIFAHATATQQGDPAEIEALKKAFGDELKHIPITAIKSMHGHLLGGAGVTNAISAIRAIDRGIIPPVINLSDLEMIEDVKDLDIVTKTRKVNPQTVLALAYGFGGYDAAVLFGKYNH
ncbi:MAG: hypothetical protein HYT06_02135 [Candidatus Levybacteria bacterium]|nr:hypothetical protein [Candidatus Levybacteria bacterium]